jgi:CubicO group peptidase (beta-lactamase class C family)
MDAEELRQALEDAVREEGIVGAGAAFVHGGRVVEAAAGMANVAAGISATPDTLFQVGSTTKVINAALVMSVVDEGLVDLDTSVTEYAGDAWAPDVTLRQLLSMTSGVDTGLIQDIGDDARAVHRFVQLQRDVPPMNAPGQQFAYSNAGSTIAGWVVERVTGDVWDKALAERVLDPTGMKHSASTLRRLAFHRFAVGHRRTTAGEVEPIRPIRFGRCRAPAGSTLSATAGDLVRFAQVMLTAGKGPGGGTVLSEHAVRAMHTPHVDVPPTGVAEQWCLGPYTVTMGGHVSYGHRGGALGGASDLRWIPELDLSVSVVTNTPALIHPLIDRVQGEILRRHGVTPSAPVPRQPVHDVDLSPYPGSYTYSGGGVRFEVRDGALVSLPDGIPPVPLQSLGDGLFSSPFDGRQLLAFVGNDNGRATHFLNGVFALRRTPDVETP